MCSGLHFYKRSQKKIYLVKEYLHNYYYLTEVNLDIHIFVTMEVQFVNSNHSITTDNNYDVNSNQSSHESTVTVTNNSQKQKVNAASLKNHRESVKDTGTLSFMTSASGRSSLLSIPETTSGSKTSLNRELLSPRNSNSKKHRPISVATTTVSSRQQNNKHQNRQRSVSAVVARRHSLASVTMTAIKVKKFTSMVENSAV